MQIKNAFVGPVFLVRQSIRLSLCSFSSTTEPFWVKIWSKGYYEPGTSQFSYQHKKPISSLLINTTVFIATGSQVQILLRLLFFAQQFSFFRWKCCVFVSKDCITDRKMVDRLLLMFYTLKNRGIFTALFCIIAHLLRKEALWAFHYRRFVCRHVHFHHPSNRSGLNSKGWFRDQGIRSLNLVPSQLFINTIPWVPLGSIAGSHWFYGSIAQGFISCLCFPIFLSTKSIFFCGLPSNTYRAH